MNAVIIIIVLLTKKTVDADYSALTRIVKLINLKLVTEQGLRKAQK